MRLRQLIKILKDENLDKVLKLGFCNPHSYRGYYEQLAFEPSQNVRVGDMLDAALDACGKTFTGYNGGQYIMLLHVEVWISEYGSCSGEMIGPRLLNYMLKDEVDESPK